MKQLSNIQRVAYSLVIVLGVGYLLFVGKALLMPLLYALLIAIAIAPIDKRFRSWGAPAWLSIIGSFLVVLLPMLIVIVLMVWQVSSIIEGLPGIANGLRRGSEKAFEAIGQFVPLPLDEVGEMLSSDLGKLLQKPLSMLGSGLQSTGTLMVDIGLCIVYTFFLLLYRQPMTELLVGRFRKSNRKEVQSAIDGIKETVQAYIGGMGLVMILLAVVNSIGMYLIGIKYALFWGVLVGTLAIIPYIGTFVSGLMPFLYAIATTDTMWQPIAVVVFFTVVQQLEGNLITPNIVGSKVDVNPFFAVLALVFFGHFWGIGGIILSIPIVAISRIILKHIKGAGAYVALLGSDLGE